MENIMLSKSEAIDAVDSGHRVRHRLFTTGEFVEKGFLKDLIFEDGVQCSWNEFWKYRQIEAWDTGWELIF